MYTLMQEGTAFFFIASGQCAVDKDGVGNVAILDSGASFGEVAGSFVLG